MTRLDQHLLHLGLPAVLKLDEAHGLTRALARSPATAEGLAAALGLDPRATGLVLDVLAAAGRCTRDAAGTWRADPDPPAWPWLHLDAFLRTGALACDLDEPEERDRLYAHAVVDLAHRQEALAAALARRLPPAGAVLDVGAGAGPWSLAMAARHPGTRATAFDRPEVLPRFREAAARLGLGDRSDTVAGSFDGPLPEGPFDRIVLANVLHLLPEAEAAALVARAVPRLAPGGSLVIVDCIPRADGLDALACTAYALHLGIRTRRGRVHPRARLARWCRAAGLPRTRLLRLEDRGGVGVFVASA